MSFLLTDPAVPANRIKDQGGCAGIPAVRPGNRGRYLDETGKMSLTFARDLQAEVVPPPQVTPQNASGYSAEVTRIGTDVLFDRKSPADAAEELLAVIEESSRSGKISP